MDKVVENKGASANGRQRQRFHIYCDESSQNAHHYIVIGTTICRSDAAPLAAARLRAVIERNPCTSSELKWSELKKHKLRLYKEFVSEFFAMMMTDRPRLVRFKAMVVDATTLDHKKYSEGDNDLGFTKLLFTALHAVPRDIGASLDYWAFLDKRETRHDPQKLMWTLNNKAKSTFNCHDQPFKDVRFADSKSSLLIQATDLVIGAMAYELNAHHLKVEPTHHKFDLMRHVASCARLDTLTRPAFRWPNFVSWHLSTRKR